MKRQKGITIQEVKAKCEKKYLHIVGIEGIGITEENGDCSITFYVSTKEVTKKIPTSCDGFPVKVEHTGTFTAF